MYKKELIPLKFKELHSKKKKQRGKEIYVKLTKEIKIVNNHKDA